MFHTALGPLLALVLVATTATAQVDPRAKPRDNRYERPRETEIPFASPANFEAGLAESRNGKVLVVVMNSYRDPKDLWTAWNDASVKEWIATNVTCLRYYRGRGSPEEVEVKALAEVELGVVAYRNGEIYDRDTSFATAADLLDWLKRVKEGTITAEYARARAGERLETTPTETRVILAERLDRVGDTAGADAEYAWLLERYASLPRRKPEDKIGQYDQIVPMLSFDARKRGIAHLQADKEASARLAAIRDKAATDAEANPDDGGAISTWMDLQMLVPDPARLAAWYERVCKGNSHASRSKTLWPRIFTLLVNANDWATAGRIMDRPLGKLGVLTMRAEMIQLARDETPDSAGEIGDLPEEKAPVYWGSMYYAALLAADRETDARLVAETLIEYSNRPITHRALVRMALQAKEPREIHRDWADIADSNEKTIEKIRPEVDEALKAAVK